MRSTGPPCSTRARLQIREHGYLRMKRDIAYAQARPEAGTPNRVSDTCLSLTSERRHCGEMTITRAPASIHVE